MSVSDVAIPPAQLFSDWRTRVIDQCDRLCAAATTHGVTVIEERLTRIRQRLVDGQLSAVFVGEFKRGKSTLLNAVLGDTSLLPVDSIPATNVVLTIEYGEREEVSVVFQPDPEGGEIRVEEIDRGEIARYATEEANPGNVERVQLVRIRVPNPALGSGIVLVDTPGVGSAAIEHTQATTAYLPSADVVVFVADLTETIGKRELDFLTLAAHSAQVTDDADGLIHVLTKADAVDDLDARVARERVKIANASAREPSDLRLAVVSAQAHLAYLAGGDPHDRDLGNLDEFTGLLWTALSRRRTTLLLSEPLHEIEQDSGTLIELLDRLREASRAENSQDVEKLAAQARDRLDAQARLANPGAWQARLDADFATLRTILTRSAKQRITEQWQRVQQTDLYDPELLDDPQRLSAKIESERALILGEIQEQATRGASKILRELAEAIGLKVTNPALRTLPAPEVPALKLGKEDHDVPAGRWLTRLQRTAFGVTLGGAGGGFAGAVAGVLAGTAIAVGSGGALLPLAVAIATYGGTAGGVIGGGAGGYVSYRTAKKMEANATHSARRNRLEKQIASSVARQEEQARVLIEALDGEYRAAVTRELQERLAVEQAGLRQQVMRIEQALGSAQDHIEAEEKELDAALRELESIRDEARTVVDELARSTAKSGIVGSEAGDPA